MTEAIINALKVIQIEKSQGHGPALTLTQLQALLCEINEATAVIQPDQVILSRHVGCTQFTFHYQGQTTERFDLIMGKLAGAMINHTQAANLTAVGVG